MRIGEGSSDVCSSKLARQERLSRFLCVSRVAPRRRDRTSFDGVEPRAGDRLYGGELVDLADRIAHRDQPIYRLSGAEVLKSVVAGKSVSVRVDRGGRRIIKEKKLKKYEGIV